MPVLNKPELIAEIAEKLDKSKADVERFLNAFQDTVIDAVSDGKEVKISGFVAFSQTTRDARVMKNPRTGEDVQVAESTVPRLRALKHFRDRVAESKKN